MPWAKNLPLPKEVKDVTDFFIKLNKTKKDFEILMSVAEPIKFAPVPKIKKKKYNGKDKESLAEAKKVPLENYLRFKNDFANCPFHADKTPSLHRFGDNKERWKCFSCGAMGDVVDLVSKINNVGLKEAIKIILN